MTEPVASSGDRTPDSDKPPDPDAVTTDHPEIGASPTPGLILSTLGVVYGDIGTSPLYALRESLRHAHEHHMAETAVIGIVSLLFWTVVLIVSNGPIVTACLSLG